MRRQRHRLLFISYTSPLVPFSGYSYRTLGVLKWLLTRFRVDLVFQGETGDLSKSFIDLKKFVKIKIIPAHRLLTRKFLGIIGNLPYHHALFSSPAMKEAISAILRENTYDLIWLNKTVHFPALSKIKNLPPIIIDQHAAALSTWDNLIKADPRWYARWFFKWNKYRVLRYENLVYKHISGVICISESDQAVTRKYYPYVRSIYIPQGVDYNYYVPDDSVQPDLNTLLFSGTQAMRNLQAVKIFIREIMPLIQRELPDMKLLWIGNINRAKHRFLELPWLKTTGFVDHAPPYFNRGMIFIAPFNMGEGMKTKILEAMAMGKVIVSTKLGIVGLDVENLPFVKVCDRYDAFAQAVVELRNDPKIFYLGQLARQYAQKNYSWDYVLSPLDSFLNECIKEHYAN